MQAVERLEEDAKPALGFPDGGERLGRRARKWRRGGGGVKTIQGGSIIPGRLSSREPYKKTKRRGGNLFTKNERFNKFPKKK